MRTTNQLYIAQFPEPNPEAGNFDAKLVGRFGASLGHKLYVDAHGRPMKPERVKLMRDDPKWIAVSRLYIAGSDVTLEQRQRRIRPQAWVEARRAEPSKIAGHCVLALGDLGLYDADAEAFRIGKAEVGLADYYTAISGLPELTADPPKFNGPGCAEDLVSVARGIFRVTEELLGAPVGAVCEVTYALVADYANL